MAVTLAFAETADAAASKPAMTEPTNRNLVRMAVPFAGQEDAFGEARPIECCCHTNVPSESRAVCKPSDTTGVGLDTLTPPPQETHQAVGVQRMQLAM